MINKKAQGMSTSTIILLILGLVILVVLILGFTMGWNKLVPFLSSNNIETIKNSCGIACSTGSQFEFCSVLREVKDGMNKKFETTCQGLITDPVYSARGYGIESCLDLCPVVPTE
jgi:hypothetical protein